MKSLRIKVWNNKKILSKNFGDRYAIYKVCCSSVGISSANCRSLVDLICCGVDDLEINAALAERAICRASAK